MHQVVQDRHLRPEPWRLERAAVPGIAGRDGQRRPRRCPGATRDADPAADQGAEHREETPVLVLDRGGVAAVLVEVAVAVQQVRPRDPHLVEGQPAVVDSREPALGPQSSMVTPGSTVPSASRTGTRTQCTPWEPASVTSWAKTAAIRASRTALPM